MPTGNTVREQRDFLFVEALSYESNLDIHAVPGILLERIFFTSLRTSCILKC